MSERPSNSGDNGQVADARGQQRRWIPWVLALVAVGLYIGSILYIVFIRGEI